jgi:site-specific recombinase XerC
MSEFSIKQYQNEVEKIIHFGGTKETANRNECFDIYNVSKMLGHRNLKTTQVYAKIISQTKRDAANKIHLDF